MYTSRVNKKNELKNKIVKKIVKENDLIIHKPFISILKTITKSKLLAFAV